jgi:translation initiation factor IF-1
MLFGDSVLIYCENHKEHTNTLPNKIYEFNSYLTGNILRLRYKDQRLMLFGETVAVYCENHKEHTDTLPDKIH